MRNFIHYGTKVLNYIGIVLLVLMLSGCSRIKLVYGQLDWLLPYYLKSYMPLSRQQSKYLKLQVEQLLSWHCGNQLTEYARIIRDANQNFQDGSMTPPAIDAYSERIKQFWANMMQQISPVFVQLLYSASDEQLQHLFDKLEKDNREWLKDFNKLTAQDLREEYLENTTDELEKWFGPLHAGQKQQVDKWLLRFQPLGMDGWHIRKSRQARLRELVKERQDIQVLQSGIEHMLLNPEQMRTPKYQKLLDDNLAATIELIYQVGRQLTTAQRRHLTKEVDNIAGDFEDLACSESNKLAAGSGSIRIVPGEEIAGTL